MGEEKHDEELIKLKFDEVASIIEKGDSDELRRVLERGQFTDINERKGLYGQTLLMIACKSGFIDCVKVLLDYKASLNRGYEVGEILRCACHSGSVEMVRFIIASGLSVCDEAIMSVFQSEDLMKFTEIIIVLIEHICNININFRGTFICWASKVGNVAIVRALLEKGADPHKVYYTCDDSLTAASGEGHLEVVKLLLTWDHATGKRIWQDSLVRALDEASCYGHIDVVRCLIEYRLDTSVLRSVIWTAVESNQVEVAEYLLNIATDSIRLSMNDLLGFSCRHQFVDMVRMLIARGVDPNATDTTGHFPLQEALRHPDIVEVLLEAGADPNIHFKDGKTALFDVAMSFRVHECEVTLLLLQHGADPNLAYTETGMTPLILAALAASIDLVKVLLEHGADVTQATHAGKTVLDMVADDPMYAQVVELCMQYIDINQQVAKPFLK